MALCVGERLYRPHLPQQYEAGVSDLQDRRHRGFGRFCASVALLALRPSFVL